jgi:hypothetical protein
MQDAQSGQSGDRLLGQHRRAVVGHQGARQAALHERLGQPVHQHLGGFVGVPLQVTDQARAIVDDAEQQRREPGSGRREHLARAVMEIQVPQRRDVLDLEAAHLALFQAIARGQRAGGVALGGGAAHHPVGLQVAPHARIGRHRGGGAGEGRGQVVAMQLGGPTGMIAVLRLQGLAGGGQHTREGPAVGAHAIAQHRHRIGRRRARRSTSARGSTRRSARPGR